MSDQPLPTPPQNAPNSTFGELPPIPPLQIFGFFAGIIGMGICLTGVHRAFDSADSVPLSLEVVQSGRIWAAGGALLFCLGVGLIWGFEVKRLLPAVLLSGLFVLGVTQIPDLGRHPKRKEILDNSLRGSMASATATQTTPAQTTVMQTSVAKPKTTQPTTSERKTQP